MKLKWKLNFSPHGGRLVITQLALLLTMASQAFAASSNTAPVAPSNLAANALSTSQVGLKFTDNSDNEQGFVVMRSLNSSSGFSKIATLGSNIVTYTDSGLSASTTYYYRVAAFRKAKGSTVYSAYSNLATVTTLAAQTSPAPAPAPSPSPSPDPNWVRCANEWGVCSFSGTRQVRFGANNSFVYKTATSSINCTNDAFGSDPAPGVVKACDYSSTETAPAPSPSPSPAPAPAPSPSPSPSPVPTGSTLTNIKLVSRSSSDQINVPVTFGQLFVQGALLPSEGLVGVLADNSTVALQVNVKAKHSDGSVRHAIISAVIPKLVAGQALAMNIDKAASVTSTTAQAPTELLNSGFTSSVNLNVSGVTYSASADAFLRAGSYNQWLSGSIANEFLVNVPFKDSSGSAHPHLMARFAIRHYAGLNRARVDVTIENNWAYQAAPQNITYDAQIVIAGNTVYTKSGLKHFHHARWRKTFWSGAEPLVHTQHNMSYLIQTKAIPYYDPSLSIPESTLSDLANSFTADKDQPMLTGLTQPYMGTAGGRPDIGLNPSWAVTYLVSQDARAKNVTLRTADLAGTFSMHYRDQATDLPLSIVDYPYSTLLGNPGDTVNPATGKSEAFPACGGDCTTQSEPDSSHQPNLNYIPYIVTGDYYQLEELQFWSMYNVFQYNPYYREFSKGLVKADQLRGQGWALRTIADAAYITPDNHPLKSQLQAIVNNNLDWYNGEYTNNASANVLGVIVNGFSISYNNSRGIAPWMDDFFTQSIGHLAELGFSKAQPLLVWKSKFQIARMLDPNYCWIEGSTYSLNIRDSETSPFYTSMGQAYLGTLPAAETSLACGSQEMATYLNLQVGEMTGWSYSTEGYPSNYQPALAYASKSGAANGATAWQKFMSRTVKPNYNLSPQFAIVPRP